MNKKIIIIGILTIAALVILTLFSFGPLSNIRKKTEVNPASLKPIEQTPQGTLEFQTYNNIDVKENYYQISTPKDWKATAGNASGAYILSLLGGNGEVRLMDVPDNTTLELYVLSQEEPRIKKSVSNYQQLDYQKIKINGNEGYKIIYSEDKNQGKTNTIAVYIAGQDHAGVITLGTPADTFSSFQPIFDKVINSFNWQNK